ncbi:recombinase family protein [Candidatus Microgenomates bacterium]|nr:MAG: recombinase family protein [Candidatus Microgenomates bacterium]
MNIVALYARVSSQRQENEQTIDTQIFAIKEYAKANNLTIVKEYKDEGWSGTILARPSLDELRLDAKNKLWEGVIVYDPDRLARKYSYQSLIIDELEEAGVKVLFVTTPPPKDDSDRLLYGVKGLFAEYERARIADRFRLGKLRKAREGNVVTTEAPYGYAYIPKQGQRQGYYKINPLEAEVVKMIFSWIGEEGLTIRKVIVKLQEQNIKPRKSKRGVWNNSTLVTLLRNETYIGKAHYLKSYAIVPENPLKQEKYKKVKKTSRKFRPQEEWIAIPAPKIIEETLFEKTRQQLKFNFELCQRNRKNEYLLSGKIYCTCGKRRNGEGPQKGKHLYYRCSSRVHSFPLRSECKEKGINARIADKLVWERLSKFMSSPDLIKKHIEGWVSRKHEKIKIVDSSSVNLEAELEKLKKEEQKYLKVYGAELINFEQLKDALNDLKIKRVALERQLESTNNVKVDIEFKTPSYNQIESFTKKTIETLPNLRFDIRQAIVRKLVDKIVANQQEMIVSGYLPLGKEEEYVKLWSVGRDCRITKCR